MELDEKHSLVFNSCFCHLEDSDPFVTAKNGHCNKFIPDEPPLAKNGPQDKKGDIHKYLLIDYLF